MSSAAIERHAIRTAVSLGAAGALAGSLTFLLIRLLGDIHGKPWQEDEAVAGLISARPLGDLLHTVLLDRGGAPLHFLLVHAAFAIGGSAQTVRWLSLAFALATVPLCYDLARRLAGPFAGMTAAALAATSQLLTIYGTFGRMYSLFAFASTLALDLFVRAVEEPRRGTLFAATFAALLPLAVHPFGLFLFAAELAVAVWLWRLRALGVGLLAVPLVLPALRLSGRYDPDVGMPAPETALRALGGSAGGYGVSLVVFALLAAVGAWTLPRAFSALGCLAIVGPPAVLVTAGAAGITSDGLAPRHLVFVLPVWIAFVATGIARMPARLAIAVAAVTVSAFAPSAVADPRTIASGEAAAVAGPAAWLRTHIEQGDVLYPYSPVFLAALPQAGVGRAFPREPVSLERAVRRTRTVHDVLVALPLRTPLPTAARRRLATAGIRAHAFRSWLILETRGPFTRVPKLLGRAASILRGSSAYSSVLQLRGAACRC